VERFFVFRGEKVMMLRSPAQISDDPAPWQRPEPPPFRPPEPPPNRPGNAPPFTPPEPPPFKRPEPPPWGPWFRGKIGGIREWLRRVACPVAVIALVGVPTLAHAQIVSGTDPSTIIDAALTFILGPVGLGLAALGLIVMLLQITRFGLAGLLIYVGIISGVFGSAYVVQQILGGAGTGG
jgi:type IV secretory pathway VirB2 component (pilin)